MNDSRGALSARDAVDLPGRPLRTERGAPPPHVRSRAARARAVLAHTLGLGLAPALLALGLIGGWEAWVRLRDVQSYLLPPPSAVARALADDPMRFIDAARLSLTAALGGLLVASAIAFALAVVMAHSRQLERALYPPALMIKVTPIVAVYPLFTIWFGFGIWPKMLIAALITFFPMLVNAVVGLRSVDPSALDFMRALDASRWQIFWRLRLPSSLPFVFAALRISVPLSLIGAVVAEFLSGSSGMGQLILIANGDFDTPALFGAIVVLAVLGVSLTALVSYVERRVLFWHESSVGT
ncbi:MAG: ABC transporter permease [Chloroflexi bacterium]|nr:ABC transporter permease [Chloroflexota bacterium]